MNQETKDYILNKYGEETLKGVENGTIFINDKTLNEMIPKRKFIVEVGDLSNDKLEDIITKWKEIIADNLTLGEMPDMMKSDLIQTIPNDDEKIDYYRWNFNHKVGDVVKFADGGFDELNKNSWMTLNPEIATKSGILIECRCEIDAWAKGSSWTCKVDFDGEIVETLCGFFEKV